MTKWDILAIIFQISFASFCSYGYYKREIKKVDFDYSAKRILKDSIRKGLGIFLLSIFLYFLLIKIFWK